MKPDEFTLGLKKLRLSAQKYINNDAPRIAGRTAVNFFADSFLKEGFTNRSLRKWVEVKRRQNAKVKGAAAVRKILTGETGDLGRSIDYKVGKAMARIFSDKPYAAAHNKGTSKAGRNRRVRIPKRQFIGDSYELNQRIIKEVTRKLKKL